jgi:hypothetical protein
MNIKMYLSTTRHILGRGRQPTIGIHIQDPHDAQSIPSYESGSYFEKCVLLKGFSSGILQILVIVAYFGLIHLTLIMSEQKYFIEFVKRFRSVRV